jgi:hypothetical protein
MAAGQTLPNIALNSPMWEAQAPQNNNPAISLECYQLRLTAAQLNALKTTPIQLLPPPGGNNLQVLWIDNIQLKYNFVTTPYTLNLGTLKLFYGPVANAHPLTPDLSAILTAGASRISASMPQATAILDTLANMLNQAIYIGNDGTANYTLGDATLDVTVSYSRTTP